VIYGSVASAGLAIFTSTRIAAAAVTRFFAVGGNAGSGYDVAFSLALVGAGHLVGLSVGMAMLTGLIIAWAAQCRSSRTCSRSRRRVAGGAHRIHLAQSGALHRRGAIAVAAIWTLLKLAKPVVRRPCLDHRLVPRGARRRRAGPGHVAGLDRDPDGRPASSPQRGSRCRSSAARQSLITAGRSCWWPFRSC
jgi:hypothetical protein